MRFVVFPRSIACPGQFPEGTHARANAEAIDEEYRYGVGLPCIAAVVQVAADPPVFPRLRLFRWLRG